MPGCRCFRSGNILANVVSSAYAVTGRQPLFLYVVDVISQLPRAIFLASAFVSLKCRIRNELKSLAVLL